MKRCICCVLLVMLLTLSACGRKTDILGVWEQNMETTVLGEGVSGVTTIVSLQRFTCREDGSGVQEHIMLDGD